MLLTYFLSMLLTYFLSMLLTYFLSMLLTYFLYGKENRLWQMSIKCVVNGVPLGRIVNHIRVGHTSVPAAHLPELERMGFQDGRSYFDCYFEFINMPALRACVYGQEKRLSETPAAYVTDDGMPLGQLLRRIKRGRSSIPNACREEMTLRGLSENQKEK
jgi:hypothetical protein